MSYDVLVCCRCVPSMVFFGGTCVLVLLIGNSATRYFIRKMHISSGQLWNGTACKQSTKGLGGTCLFYLRFPEHCLNKIS